MIFKTQSKLHIYRICTNSIYMHLCVCVHACTHLSLLDQSVLKTSNWSMQKCRNVWT